VTLNGGQKWTLENTKMIIIKNSRSTV